jgi:ATP-dependent DNA helicase RecG
MGEKHIIEYKRLWKDEWLEWICGMANADGGVIYIGIKDDGEVLGVSNAKKLMEDIPNKIISKMSIYPDVRQIEKDGKDVIEIEVAPSIAAVSLDGVVYKRVGATNQILKGTALQEFYLSRPSGAWDARIIPDAKLDEIDPDAVEYLKESGIRKGRLSKESAKDSVEKVLKSLNLMTEDDKLTMAALLLFGKNPQQYCIDARFKIGRFGAGAANLIIQDLVDGDLIRMPDRVLDILDAKYLVRPIHYKGLRRVEPLEIPEKGLREIICNSIIHKQYDGPDIQMRVYDDRIDLWNFGKLPEGYTFEQMFMPHRSMPRNKLIANAFYYAGLIEAWGRGFEIITEEFTKDGLAVPTFKEEFGGVTAIIKREIFQAIQLGSRGNSKQDDPKNDPNSDPNNLTERQSLIIGILENQGQPDDPNNEPETRSSIAKKLEISESTVKRELAFLSSIGKIKHFGPRSHGRWMVIRQ